MYFPYFRGKQYELLAIKECAQLMARSAITPIIEPVKKNPSSLLRSLRELKEEQCEFVLVSNPKHGELMNNSLELFNTVVEPEDLVTYSGFHLGYIVDAESNLLDIVDFIDEHKSFTIALIHYGYHDGKELSDALQNFDNIQKHIFIDGHSGKVYQRHFRDKQTILVRDGFIRRRNADYPPSERFSDLHITYDLESMNGFGDFLIVGDDYMDSGGPAYAVAIHLTYIGKEEEMYIRHFLSDTNETYLDPGGKFLEALGKMVAAYNAGELYRSNACGEFLELHRNNRYPGLGFVKKLSMKHHVELMASIIEVQ